MLPVTPLVDVTDTYATTILTPGVSVTDTIAVTVTGIVGNGSCRYY